MAALPSDVERSLLESAYGVEVVDSWDLRHRLHRDVDLSELGLAGKLSCHREVVEDRVCDVGQGLLLGGSLRPATRQARH